MSRGSGLRLHHEASGAGRDDVQHGERRAPLAGRGQPVHPDLARPRQVRLALGPHLHLPNRGVPVINQRLDHVQRTTQKQIRAVPEIQIPRVSRICYARPRTGRSVLIKSPEPARIQQWTDERVLLRYCTSSDHIRVLRKLRTDLVRQVGLRVGLRRSRKATAMAAASTAEAVTCGRGDKKTKRGKRFKGSYGNARPKREKKIERIKDRVEVPRSTPWPLPFKLI